MRRWTATGLVLTAALWLSGCRGLSAVPADITTTTATLRAQTECLADTTTNPCTGWFQYWADGSTTIATTPKVTVNAATGGLTTFQQQVTGLSPDTLYHYQFCGYGDSNVAQPGTCIGPNAITAPGQQPDPGNHSATQNFRTASTGTVATVDLGRVLSSADTAQRPISRDGGLSAAYSGSQALWIFGDTVQQNGPFFLAWGTAAAGPYAKLTAPQGLHERPRPPAAPQPNLPNPANFFPAVQGLMTPDNPPVACGSEGSNSYAAAWLSGAARIPGTSHLLLTWAEICVAQGEGRGWPVERLRMTEYDPATNQFVRLATPFVANPLSAGLPSTRTLANPVFGSDGYLYFFGGRRDPEPRQVFVSRVPASPAAWGDPAQYRWWGTPGGAPAQWTSDHTSVVSVLSGVDPWGVYAADFSAAGRGLAIVVKDSFYDSPHFRLYTAASPTGPWTAGPQGRVPDNCQGGGFGCYAFHGHAELSTSDTFVFSWFSPGDSGRIHVGSIKW
jgi:hypothetical protein